MFINIFGCKFVLVLLIIVCVRIDCVIGLIWELIVVILFINLWLGYVIDVVVIFWFIVILVKWFLVMLKLILIMLILFSVVILLVGWIKELILIWWMFSFLLNGVWICRLVNCVLVIVICVFSDLINVCCLFSSCCDVVLVLVRFLIWVSWCFVLFRFICNWVICVIFLVLLSWISNCFCLMVLLLLNFIWVMVFVICVVRVIDLLVLVVFNVFMVMGNKWCLIVKIFIGVVCCVIVCVMLFLG